MGNVRIELRQFRNLTQNSSGTSSVSIPVEYVRALGWQKGQKVKLVRRGQQLLILPAKLRWHISRTSQPAQVQSIWLCWLLDARHNFLLRCSLTVPFIRLGSMLVEKLHLALKCGKMCIISLGCILVAETGDPPYKQQGHLFFVYVKLI